MDVIEQAFAHDWPRNWDRLAHWLKAHAGSVNGVQELVRASEQASIDGVLFPSGPEEARNHLKKYLYQNQNEH